MREFKKTKTEEFKNNNPQEALERVMAYYGDEIPRDTSKNIKCPFHNDNNPSFNIKNGYFKCFSECGAKGDAFDYIMLKENCTFQEALIKASEIFGIEENLNKNQLSKDELLNNYIRENMREFSKDATYKYEEHYLYKDEKGVSVFVKIKFRRAEDNKKTFIMANLEDKGTYYKMVKGDKVNMFYNTHLIERAIKDGKKIYITEGEKDANTLTSLGYVAISCRNSKNISFEMANLLFRGDVVIVSDTDKVGKEHERVLKNALIDKVKSLRVLRNYELVKNNCKDITEFIIFLKDKGLNNTEIKEIINELTYSSLDLNDHTELQQTRRGIKKYKLETSKETKELIETEVSLTNFFIKEANLCINEDTNAEEIEIVAERYKYIYSDKKETKIIRGEVKEIFTDIKSFTQKLSLGMSFYGTSRDLISLKEWIDRYFLNDVRNEYLRVGIRDDLLVDGEKQKGLITQNGVLLPSGEFREDIIATTQYSSIDLNGRKILTKDEAECLMEHLFKFTSPLNVSNILGSVVSSMLNPYFNKSMSNPHILHIVGASGTGKSFALNNIIMPILNNDVALSFFDTTPHALRLAFDATNTVTLLEEVKPSKAKGIRLDTLSGAIRELTGNVVALKGRKDQGANRTSYNSTLICVGEEFFTETALQNRSNTVVYTVKTTTPQHIAHGKVLMTDKYRKMLNNLGYTLYLEILSNWNAEKIDEMKEIILKEYPLSEPLNMREENTYTNTVLGLIILQDVFKKSLGISKLDFVTGGAKLVEANLRENVLEGAESTKQNYELWLEKFEDLVSTADEKLRLDVGIHFRKVIENGEECLAIAFTESYNMTYKYCQQLDEKLENNRTLKKLLINSQYAHPIKTKKYKFYTSVVDSKTKDAVVLRISELEKLNMLNTIEQANEYYKKK